MGWAKVQAYPVSSKTLKIMEYLKGKGKEKKKKRKRKKTKAKEKNVKKKFKKKIVHSMVVLNIKMS